MKNVKQLRDNLLEDYKNAKAGTLDNQTANTLSNIAGKIIKSAAVELGYNQYMKNGKKIKFLEAD